MYTVVTRGMDDNETYQEFETWDDVVKAFPDRKEAGDPFSIFAESNEPGWFFEWNDKDKLLDHRLYKCNN